MLGEKTKTYSNPCTRKNKVQMVSVAVGGEEGADAGHRGEQRDSFSAVRVAMAEEELFTASLLIVQCVCSPG